MSYSIVTGTTGNNILLFEGIVGSYDKTLVNPYSGYTVNVTGTKNINNAIYDGRGGTDTLAMTALGDVLTLVDSSGTIMIQNVEIINAGLDGDIIILADAVATYGNVTLRGSDGDDILWSNNGNDLIQGGLGNDIIDGGAGNDTIYGGEGNDYLAGGAGADTLAGGQGDDTLVYNADGTWSSAYTLASLGSALSFAASINLGGMVRSRDTFNGDAADDLSVPTTGTDTLIMTSGDDVLSISDVISPVSSILSPRVAFMEIIDAGAGNDIVDLSGDSHQSVTIYGGDGDDILAGSIGNDTIYGDAGNDRLVGGEGNDTLYGGMGNDTYYYDQGNDKIIESGGNDTLFINAGTFDDLTLAVSGMDLKIIYGSDTITIQNHFAADGSGRVETLKFSDNSTFNLGAWSQNVNPNAQNDAFQGNENAIITGNVLANDTDTPGDILTVVADTFLTENFGEVVLNADGTFTYKGAEGFNGSDSFTYTVNDNRGGSSTATVTINVLSVNDDPVAQDDIFIGFRNETITGNVLADNGNGEDSDSDGGTLTVQAQTIATVQGGTVSLAADGSFTYMPAAGYYGSDSFNYTLLDGQGGSDVGTAHLTVSFANLIPDLQDDTFSGNENSLITGNVLSNDSTEPGETLSALAETLTTVNGASVTIQADGTFTYLGAPGFSGQDSFLYTATDGIAGGVQATVYINVASVNDAPVAVDDVFSGYKNAQITGNVLSNDTDGDGDTLSAQAQTIVTAEGGNVVLNANGSFVYTPKAGFYGNDSFSYNTLDGYGGSDTGNVALIVNLNPAQSIIGTAQAEVMVGTSGANEIFGLNGDDILYGDYGVSGAPVMDKVFADTIVAPELKERTNIANLKPPGTPALGIADGNLSVNYDATATITFKNGQAGYNNSLGTFALAADGTIKMASLEWKNVKTAGVDIPHQIDLPVGASGGDFGFFIIANGDNVNSGYAGLNVGTEGNIQFIYNYGKAGQREAKITDDGKKVTMVYNDGVTTKVLQGQAYFTTERGESTAINRDGKVHVISGLIDKNNQHLDIRDNEIGVNKTSFTKDGITLTAMTGYLTQLSAERIGILSPAHASTAINAKETMRVEFDASEKVVLTLKGLDAGRGIDFKIYVDGDMSHPIAYEFPIGSLRTDDVTFNSSSFGGLITAIDITSVKNSALGVDGFWLSDVHIYPPGGVSTDELRIGFEDLVNTGDADYEDVLFDLNINPIVMDHAGGNDLLDGGVGNDTLYGEGGNDILVIGLGQDSATGGSGADIFAITKIDSLVDTIVDFKASEGDKINVADVLEGYDPLSDNIADFIHLVQNGGNTEIQINADGVGGDFVTAALVLGGTGADLATMIANGTLVADHSALA